MIETPTVSFLVPCYKLAHFLAECIHSILSQSYKNIEIIILDDQSPDNTATVSQKIVSANPGRNIVYVRNPENLGNILNYNKGIGMAAGKHVWILSPDDRLRSENIVAKYVRLMESDPEVGYIFCPAHNIENGQDIGIEQKSVYRTKDQILNGRQLVKDIVDNDFWLLAPSVMIRKECYEEVTLFPEEMPHRGDSYVWSLIAMRRKVGYFAAAMIDYRLHEDSMMSTMMRENMAKLIKDDIAVQWRVKAEAERQGLDDIAHHCEHAVVRTYARALSGVCCRGYSYRLTRELFEVSLSKYEANPVRRSRIRARVLTSLGDRLHREDRIADARKMYLEANANWRNINRSLKLILLRSGKLGIILRRYLSGLRRLSRRLMRT
jgi:glycosyltransferase involved in cell wall biosynthesis